MTDEPDEYPTEDELPDEPPTVDDIDPFTVDEDNFEDIAEFAAAEMENQTPPNDH